MTWLYLISVYKVCVPKMSDEDYAELYYKLSWTHTKNHESFYICSCQATKAVKISSFSSVLLACQAYNDGVVFELISEFLKTNRVVTSAGSSLLEILERACHFIDSGLGFYAVRFELMKDTTSIQEFIDDTGRSEDTYSEDA
ncbi:hypothetical protein ACTFIU_009062 [Dictyostelium citrinum]